MTKLTSHDLLWCIRRLGPDVRKFVESNAGKVFVAGGYIRSVIARERISDIDIFISSPAQLEEYLLHLVGYTVAADDPLVYRTQNAATIRWTPRVQIIHRWTFTDAADGISRFDFTIAQAAIWYDGANWQSVCHQDFYADLAAKRIVYTSPQRDEEPGGSLLRLLKFYRRGYTAPLETIGALIARIAENVGDGLAEDAAAAEFVRLLREVDPADPLINQKVRETRAVATAAVLPDDEDEEVDF